MLKKIIGSLIALFFSLGTTSVFAQNQAQKTPKKWNPAAKSPAEQVFYNEKGKVVDINNLTKIQGKVLYDKKGNAYEIEKGQIIRLEEERQLQKRIGPAPVA